MIAIRRMQSGMTLIVATIMLVLITLVVLAAFNLSSSDLKTVNNVQVRNEAVAAANQAVEQLVGSFSATSLGAQTINVDLDKDGTSDYQVALDKPTCLRSRQVDVCKASDCDSDPLGCGASYQPGAYTPSGVTSCGSFLTDWDIKATVTHQASGAKVVVKQGIRVPLDSATASLACP